MRKKNTERHTFVCRPLKKRGLLNKAVQLTLLPMCFSLQAADIFVAEDGNDEATGSIQQPFATIQHAISIAQSNDTIYLRQGRYHEFVNFNGISGAAGAPITLTNYNNEHVVIDGSVKLSNIGATEWQPLTDAGHPNCTNNCYKTTISPELIPDLDGARDSEDGSVVKGIWQLWVPDAQADGAHKMMISARWPNYDITTGHPTGEMKVKSDNRTPVNDSWWDMGGTWGFMKTNWVAQKDENYDSSVLTSKTAGYNLHHLENNPAYHDLSALPPQDQGGNPLNFSGGSLILNYHSETQFSRPIESDGHQTGSNIITHRSVVDPHDQNAGYFIVEHKNALDQAGEWYFDKDTNEVWLWPEDGQNPTGKDIRGKTQSWAMDLTGSSHITLKGLQFFGTAIKCEQGCDTIVIEENEFFYPSWYPRMLGLHSYAGEENITKTDKAGSESGEGAIRLKGKNYLIKHNVFAHSDAMIDMNGANNCANENNHVVNNLFHHWSYTGLAQMAFMFNSNCESSFVRNTMHTNGSKVMVKHGKVDVSWSHVANFGYFQQDGTAFQCKGGNFEQGASNGVERHHLWGLDAMKGLGRWDGNDGVGGLDHHQISLNMSAHGNIKGDYHVVSNNTTVFPHQPSKTMFKMTATTLLDADGNGEPDIDEFGFVHPEENENSHLYNNLSSGISSDPHIAVPLLIKPGNMASNWNGFGELKTAPNLDTNAGPVTFGEFEPRDADDTVASKLRDPANFDFRPKPDSSELIDQGTSVHVPVADMNGTAVPNTGVAIGSSIPLDDPIAGNSPDIGAYEYDSSNELEYWIPGYRYKKSATQPVPRNKTQSALTTADMMWLPAREATGHIVYLGTNASNLVETCRFEGSNAYAAGRTVGSLPDITEGFTHLKNICSPSSLEPNTRYYWRVDTILADGSAATGDIWEFTVAIPAQKQTVVIEAIEDTYVHGGQPTSFFDEEDGMKLCTPSISSNSAPRISFIKFDLSSIEGFITSVNLRVKRNAAAGTTNDTGAFVVDPNWTASTLNYDLAEQLGIIPIEGVDEELAFVEKIYEGSWGDFVITEGVAPQQTELAVALKAHPSDSCGNKKLIETVDFENKEKVFNSDARHAPELVVVYQNVAADTPPSTVSGLDANIGLRSVTLNWDANTEADVVGYNVYRRDHHEDEYQFPLNLEPLTEPFYEDTVLTSGQTYEYVVRAIDEADQESLDSEITGIGLPDADADGMSDNWESEYGLDITIDDTALDADNDGLSNVTEYNLDLLPNSNDTDTDGMPDSFEVDYNLLPKFDDANWDNDGDSYSNIEEYLASTDPTDANSQPSSEPVVIFSDDFEDGNIDGWSEQGNVAVLAGAANESNFGVRIKKSSIFLLDNLDTTGYSTLNLSYDRKTKNYSGSEFLAVEYSTNGTDWQLLETTTVTSYTSVDFSFTAGNSLSIRFVSNSDRNTEQSEVDNVVITAQ